MKRLLFYSILAITTISASCSRNSNNIVVDDTIVKSYLSGDTSDYSSAWYFDRRGPMVKTAQDSSTFEIINKTYNVVLSMLKDYTPVNRAAIDTLFPNWREISIHISLVAGMPSPYDAITAESDEGVSTIVLDIPQLASYGMDDESLAESMRQLVTHESVHIYVKELGCDCATKDYDYRSSLDFIAYNEGYAHLLSYHEGELYEVDWDSLRYERFGFSRDRMLKALEAVTSEEEKAFITEAQTGMYYDKFGCISSMLYLSRIYQREGLSGLKRELDRGAEGMSARICDSAAFWSEVLDKYAAVDSVNRLLLVQCDMGTHAEALYYTKEEGVWTLQERGTADIGKNGLGKKVDGDFKTPEGDYGFFTAYGILPNPGTDFEYIPVTESIWACEDEGPYYNCIVDVDKLGHKVNGEHMIEIVPDYNYGLHINYNPHHEYPLGNSIFLHGKGKFPYTFGCVAVDEPFMKRMLTDKGTGFKICIYYR